MKKTIFFYGRLLFSILLVLILLVKLDITSIKFDKPLGWGFILIVFVIVNLDRLLMSYKWHLLLDAKNINISFKDTVKNYYIGTFWGIFLPGSVGGDIVRAYKVSGHTKQGRDIVSSVVLERLLGLMSMLIMGTISVALYVFVMSEHHNEVTLVFILVSVFALFTGVVLLSFNSVVTEKTISFLERYDKKWLVSLLNVFRSYQTYQHHRVVLCKFLMLSLLEQCFPVMWVFAVSRAMHFDIGLPYFFVFVPAIVALSRVPLSLDGFGIGEGMFVYFFSTIGVAGPEAFLLGITTHVLVIISLLPGSFYYSFFSGLATQKT